MVSRVDVIGLNPMKSFFTPIDLIPFVGGGAKLYKGGRLVVAGSVQVGRGVKALATGKVTLRSGQVMKGGHVKLTGAVAAVRGAKLAKKGAPDVVVGVATIYLDYIVTKKLLGRGKKSRPGTETQRIKSSRNVGTRKARKTLPRRNGRCPNGYRYNKDLKACVRIFGTKYPLYRG